MEPTNAPPEWATFLIMVVLILLALGMIFAFAGITRTWRRITEGAAPSEQPPTAARSRLRSAPASRSPRSSPVSPPNSAS
ncbi:MAG: hypothetical protein HC828_09935 [Blastochloris sp.]|nr:hypothetical protein [Blastochloris sp.]